MKKKFKMPTAYTILAIIIVMVAILTWIVPAGQYNFLDPNADKLQLIPGTYHAVPSNPQGFKDIVLAPIIGFYDAVDVILFVIVIGGFLGTVMKTGAIDAGIGRLVKKLAGKERWLIPLIMLFFTIGGTTFGMDEETLAFFPILIPVFLAAGYDTLTAVAVIKLGSGMAAMASLTSPFAISIACKFAGISIGEGIGIRMVLLVTFVALGIFWTMKYGEMVKADPTKSLIYDLHNGHKKHFLGNRNENDIPELTGRRKLILTVFGLTFVVMVMGIIPFSDLGIKFIPTLGWWFGELAGVFLVSSIIIAIIAGYKEEKFLPIFIDGARDLLGVAIIIGLARGITVVMDAGHISDTVLHLGEICLKGKGSIGFTVFTYLFYLPMSFLIPSTSGLATVTMPILAPLADFSAVPRHIVITAYQAANGLLSLFSPTCPVIMAGLVMGKVPYERWVKFIWKLIVITFVITLVLLVLSMFVYR
ncbi:YfcC family protein [Clostridium estertheticum]|uniref:YfcC family protein n=1 Tax=Clostridium estertheticum TaxID=238834 RepID=UPI0013EE9425|nr:YfcC family protein [Clostridium estertheticum]MBZ9607219.1 YfcC family protein [Clostridium estertheticum]